MGRKDKYDQILFRIDMLVPLIFFVGSLCANELIPRVALSILGWIILIVNYLTWRKK